MPYPTYSIVIPAYNEAGRIPATLEAVVETVREKRWSAEVIVVDDGSTDATADVVRRFAAGAPEIRLLQNPGNRGKGYSVRSGLLQALGDVVMFTDADLSAPIEELDKLWDATVRDGSHVAIGSRAIDRSLIGVHQPGMRETAGKIFNAVMRGVTGLQIADTQCGFKLFHGSASLAIFPRQTQERFGFDVEILFIAKKLGFRISEVPVRWNHVEGSKVGMLTGLHAFTELLQVRWNDLRGKYR